MWFQTYTLVLDKLTPCSSFKVVGLPFQKLIRFVYNYQKKSHLVLFFTAAYVSTGQVLTRLGRTTEAMGVYERCFQLTDDGVKDLRIHIEAKVTALLRFGKLLVEEDDDPRAAIKIYRRAVNLMPPNYAQAQVRILFSSHVSYTDISYHWLLVINFSICSYSISGVFTYV